MRLQINRLKYIAPSSCIHGASELGGLKVIIVIATQQKSCSPQEGANLTNLDGCVLIFKSIAIDLKFVKLVKLAIYLAMQLSQIYVPR